MTGWQVRLARADPDVPRDLLALSIPATVPGCVHTDLLAAGRIPDPYLDRNELALGWIGRSDWTYETTFDCVGRGDERADLVFEGLDTVATVELDGAEVGRAANMHRTWRFDVRHLLRSGTHRLTVRFAAPLTEVERLRAELGDWPHANREPEHYNLIRKMACDFGWDWGPKLTTVGIWRPVRLESWSGVRIGAVRPRVHWEGHRRGSVELDVELDRASAEDGQVLVTASVAGSVTRVTAEPGQSAVRMRSDVDDIDPWWPRTLGAQALYDLVVTAEGEDGTRDAAARRIGFRNVALDTTPEGDGRRWQLVVNDWPIWVRGANWIPDDCFPTRVGRARYRQRVQQAADANVDLLRVWGGGIFETDDFYDACDELGVLVWQDFPFSCATYPETPEMLTQVEAEARDNVTRLLPHPSLALWNGNNECAWLAATEGWPARLGGRDWGLGYYDELLPAVVGELDGTRPYWPGTPDSGTRDVPPNDPRMGTVHVWDVWNRLDYTEYRRNHPRFVAEFGYQGPPTWSTLRRALADPDLTLDSPGLVHHQKALDGMAKLERGLRAHFREPADFDAWHFLAQLNQARAVSVGIEHFRSIRATCSGAVVWQLNDCWPVISWAAVDGDGRRKPLWYAMRRAFADRLLTIQPDGEELVVIAVNDGRDAWSGELRLARVGLDGRVRAEASLPFEAAAGGTWRSRLPRQVGAPVDPADELLVGTAGWLRSVWSWLPDASLLDRPAAFASSVERTADGYRVRVTAESLLRDVCLFPDRLDPAASVDEMLVTLLPGETAAFEVATAELPDPHALARPPVLRSVSDGAQVPIEG
jgi:beta-mannosidase